MLLLIVEWLLSVVELVLFVRKMDVISQVVRRCMQLLSAVWMLSDRFFNLHAVVKLLVGCYLFVFM